MSISGKIKFTPTPMLLRDETIPNKSISYKTNEHHEENNYISKKDIHLCEDIFRSLNNFGNPNFSEREVFQIKNAAFNIFTKQSEKEKKPMFLEIFNKNYTNFKPYFNHSNEKRIIPIMNFSLTLQLNFQNLFGLFSLLEI